MGAIVLQKVAGSSPVQTRTIIDGQQRLTTLQLLFNAAFLATSAHQAPEAEYLRAHFKNSETFLPTSERYKLTPTTRDKNEYLSLISQGDENSSPNIPEFAPGLLSGAHEFFKTKIESWLGRSDPLEQSKALATALMQKLNLVSIELEHNEDSQQIFETLNARGTPLSGADLIKNFVFQKLEIEQVNTGTMYQRYWSDFETAFWEKGVSVGRVPTPRISVFLSHWLVSQSGQETPVHEVFRRFKLQADGAPVRSMSDTLPKIHASAETYRGWSQASTVKSGDLDRIGLFAYRTSVLGTQSAGALLVWATDPSKDTIPPDQLEQFLSSLESWLIRRALLRSGNGGIGQFMAFLVSRLEESSRDVAGDRLSQLLVESSTVNLAWPSDEDLVSELKFAPAYRRFRRPFTRMILEAVEDHLRGYGTGKNSFAEGRVQRETHSIEHLLPQQWRTNWSVGRDVAAQDERDRHVHRLGNLTLVAGGLNSKISNGSWGGPKGKLSKLNQHSVLLMNQNIGQIGESGWNEESISSRTDLLIDAMTQIWPVPAEALGLNQGLVSEGSNHDVSVYDLVRAGLLNAGQRIHAGSSANGTLGTVLEDGGIFVSEFRFDTPSGAAKKVTKRNTNGWTFWVVDKDQGVTLSTLRSRLVRSRLSSGSVNSNTA